MYERMESHRISLRHWRCSEQIYAVAVNGDLWIDLHFPGEASSPD
jgi:hypothetical protein